MVKQVFIKIDDGEWVDILKLNCLVVQLSMEVEAALVANFNKHKIYR